MTQENVFNHLEHKFTNKRSHILSLDEVPNPDLEIDMTGGEFSERRKRQPRSPQLQVQRDDAGIFNMTAEEDSRSSASKSSAKKS